MLEAHRHYALIPDVEKARKIARFGTGMLLDAAVKQSTEKSKISVYERLGLG